MQTRYAGNSAPLLPGPFVPNGETVEPLITRIVRRALTEETGDVLVFPAGSTRNPPRAVAAAERCAAGGHTDPAAVR